jgi:hypothetical protein
VLVAAAVLALAGAAVLGSQLLTEQGGPETSRAAPRKAAAPPVTASPTSRPSTPLPLGLRRGERDVVAERAERLFSYDHASLDATLAEVRAVTDGAAEREYVSTFDSVVRPVATQHKATVQAEAVEVGVFSRSARETTFLVFLNQTTTSTRVSGPQVDQSRILITLDPQRVVTAFEVAEPAEPAMPATGELAALQREVEAAVLPVFAVGAADFDGDLRRVLENSTGAFAADFDARSADLRRTMVENEVSSAVADTPLVAIQDSAGASVSALLVVDTQVTNTATPEGRRNTYRVACVLERVDGALRLAELEFVD